jgi:hypothetical protein
MPEPISVDYIFDLKSASSVDIFTAEFAKFLSVLHCITVLVILALVIPEANNSPLSSNK